MSENNANNSTGRSKKTIIFGIVGVLVAAMLIYLLINGFPGSSRQGNEDGVQTVTIEIKCDQVTDNMALLTNDDAKSSIPEDGVILAKTEYEIVAGETTVYDVFEKACAENGIETRVSEFGDRNLKYVEAINNLGASDAGRNSLWLYQVNCSIPNYSADQLTLDGGEAILWYFTTDYTMEFST